MALIVKTQVENFTDTIAAQARVLLAALREAALTPESGGLFSQLDQINNPEIEIFLGQAALDHDNRLRDSAAWLATYGAPTLAPFLTALGQQVSADGTLDNATLDGLLTEVGAQVAPEVRTLLDNAGGASLSPTNVFSPEIETAHFDAVFAGADGALADKTSAARTDAGAAITAFAANGDALYLGWNEKPTTADEYISVALSTPGSSDADLLIQYWSGTEWSTLATSDGATTGIYADHGTKGGSKSGVLQFAVPARWSRTAQNPAGDAIFDDDLTPRFYVRLARQAATLTTPPVISTLRRGIGMGLVLVKADSSAQFIPGAGVDTSRFDAVNKLKLRALTPIAGSVTATLAYTNRAGVAGRSQVQSAWSSIDPGDTLPASASSFLTLQTANEGVAAVSGVTISTAATTGAFVIESTRARAVLK